MLIRVIDFEATTGDEGGQIIEAGWCDLIRDDVTMNWSIGTGGGYLCGIDDDVPMPPDARAVHHIRRAELAGLPRYDRRTFFEDAMRAGATCLAAHGADFEGRHIMGSLPLICTYKAALRVWPDVPSHKNFALLYNLEDMGEPFDQDRAWPPHRAAADAYATAVMLRVILQRGFTGAELFEWTKQPALLPRCPIGAWRGRKWSEVDTGFLEWILRTIRDREDLPYCAALELDRREGMEDE